MAAPVNEKPLLEISKVAAHCRKVEEATPQGAVPDFSPVFECDLTPEGAGKVSAKCLWPQLYATDIDGIKLPFNWRGNLVLAAGIHPATPEGVARVNEYRTKANKPTIATVRDSEQSAPALTVGKYETAPKTLKGDNFTIDSSEPLPPLTDVGYVYWCLNIWFVQKVELLKQSGLITDSSLPRPGALKVSSAKVNGTAQTHIMKGPDVGKMLPNPLVRLRIKIDSKTRALSNLVIYDGDKMYTDAYGRRLPEIMTIDGNPVTDYNLDQVFTSGAKVAVVVKSDAVCCSSMGISIPTSVEIAIVNRSVSTRPKATINSLAGLVDGMNLEATTEDAPPIGAPGPVVPGAPAGQPVGQLAAYGQPPMQAGPTTGAPPAVHYAPPPTGAPYSAAPPTSVPYSAAPAVPYSAAPAVPYSAAPAVPYSAAPAVQFPTTPSFPAAPSQPPASTGISPVDMERLLQGAST